MSEWKGLYVVCRVKIIYDEYLLYRWDKKWAVAKKSNNLSKRRFFKNIWQGKEESELRESIERYK